MVVLRGWQEADKSPVDPAWIETSLCEDVLKHESELPDALKAAKLEEVRFFSSGARLLHFQIDVRTDFVIDQYSGSRYYHSITILIATNGH